MTDGGRVLARLNYPSLAGTRNDEFADSGIEAKSLAAFTRVLGWTTAQWAEYATQSSKISVTHQKFTMNCDLQKWPVKL